VAPLQRLRILFYFVVSITSECMGVTRAHVSIFPKLHFYGISFFICMPLNMYENSAYPVHIDLIKVTIHILQIVWEGHVMDLRHFHNYSSILVMEF
jgi:hypothetical protein